MSSQPWVDFQPPRVLGMVPARAPITAADVEYLVVSQFEHVGEVFCCITDRDGDEALGATAALVSIGLEPELARIYRRSDVPEAFELAGLLSKVLERPVAAGILGLQATVVVPVSHPIDELDEVARIVRLWNRRFPTCPLAGPVSCTETCPRVAPPRSDAARRSLTPDDIEDVLRYGALRARQEIAATLDAVREAAATARL